MPIKELFENNRRWSKNVCETTPDFFDVLAQQQNPEYLWIGCSDSRVPANQITGLLPGEVFVHRNIANVVSLSDNNCLSVVQYAVDVLKVKDIIVCGHYGCGGVEAAFNKQELGPIENWLAPIGSVVEQHSEELETITEGSDKLTRLCELNVMQQVRNLVQTDTIQNAWKNGQQLRVHGWVYSLKDGLLKNLDVTQESSS